jgi:hypothetical protein
MRASVVWSVRGHTLWAIGVSYHRNEHPIKAAGVMHKQCGCHPSCLGRKVQVALYSRHMSILFIGTSDVVTIGFVFVLPKWDSYR